MDHFQSYRGNNTIEVLLHSSSFDDTAQFSFVSENDKGGHTYESSFYS
jgi:hypothetical protein